MTERKWLLDADAMITPNRQYYPFDLCPGFWESLEQAHKAGHVFSIDRVHDELARGKDELKDWADVRKSQSFFFPTRTASTAAAFAPLMQWVQDQPQFTSAAKDEFASTTNADGWLIAAAMERKMTVVTLEVYDPNIRKRVPIPNVCREFDVPYTNVLSMLRELEAAFVLE